MYHFTCDICKNPFSSSKSKKRITCSRECCLKRRSIKYSGANSYQWKGGDVELICPICGTKFISIRCAAHRRRTCSVRCGAKHRIGMLANEKNPNWRGGRKVNDQGYVFIKARGHHRADPNGYVREHVYIMEKHLQREISRTEIVHHINGDRSDNRIENLELIKDKHAHNMLHKLKGDFTGRKRANKPCH